MIDLSCAKNENEKLALMLIKSIEDGDLIRKLEEICSDDMVWANSGLPTLNSKAEILEHIKQGGFASEIPILKTMKSFSADLIHIASHGNVVFSERMDHHWDAAGRDLMTPHIAGVIEISEGKINAFRDFYDTVCYTQKPDSLHAEDYKELPHESI